jgi:protein-tyrosine phosphatase
MKAFWWFRENKVAGMARPGFGTSRWLELPFNEAALMGWVGQYSNETVPLSSWHHHLSTYVPRIVKFHSLDELSAKKNIEYLSQKEGLTKTFEDLIHRTKSLQSFEIQADHVRFEVNQENLQYDIGFLKQKGIQRIVTLTERHHNASDLKNHFQQNHISIEDLNPPKLEQAEEFAKILKSASAKNETVAVHCLAGIGRTSTMILAAHMILGEPYNELLSLVQKGNPAFKLTGPQGEFIENLRDTLKA